MIVLFLLGREWERLVFVIRKCIWHFAYTLLCSAHSRLSVEGLKLQSSISVLALAVSQFEFSIRQNLTNLVCQNVFFNKGVRIRCYGTL